ncbi:hypothetical protein ACFLQ0_06180, partial [Nitrospinota bacterium]
LLADDLEFVPAHRTFFTVTHLRPSSRGASTSNGWTKRLSICRRTDGTPPAYHPDWGASTHHQSPAGVGKTALPAAAL